MRLLPVAALYLARPAAVSPAPLEVGSFSPRPTDRLTCVLAMSGFIGESEGAARVFVAGCNKPG